MPISLSKKLFIISIIGLFALSILMQSTLLLNWDVSWLMRATARLLQGGSYTHDFFEINPPMILYLYIPPVLFAKLTTLSNIVALRMYVFSLIALSLFTCNLLVKKIFASDEKNIAIIFIVVLAATYLILPVYEFGQREHLALIFVMPYLLSVAARLRQPMHSSGFTLFIGALAGLGFAIKPYFLLAPLLVELYYVFRTKNFLNLFRADTCTIASIILLYLASIVIWHSDYLHTVVPVVLRFYDSGFHVPILTLASQSDLLPIWTAFFLYCIQFKKSHDKPLEIILLLSLTGFLITYFWQGRIWYYHLLPSLAIALLSITLSLHTIFVQHSQKTHDFLFLPLLTLLIFFMPLYTVIECLTWSYYYKKEITPLISYLKKNVADKSFIIFASTTTYSYPAVDYAQTDNPSRFGFFGWIPGMLNRTDKQSAADTQFFIRMTVDDFRLKNPEFVLVDVNKNKSYIKDGDFNYLEYFSQDKNFKTLWKNYHYVTTLENQGFYKFDVYQKNRGLL